LAGQGNSVSVKAAAAFRPVRTHPWFIAITACWFAALFGLSGLAIRPDQMDALVRFAGMDRAAFFLAPPLGTAACALASLGLAIFGGLIGTVLGRMTAIPPSRKIGGQRKTQPSHTDSLTETIPLTAAAEAIDAAQLPPGCTGLAIGSLPLPVAVPVCVSGQAGPMLPPLGKAAVRLLAADLDTLSPIELVERLGIAMQCHNPRMPEPPATAAARPFARLVLMPPRPSPLPVPMGNEQLPPAAAGNLRISGAA